MSNEHVAASTHRLRVQLTGRDVDVVDDLDIELRPATIVGLVGESGSGKTTAGTALLGYARAGAQISGGDILVNGHDIRALPPAQVRNLRGTEIGYVPQDPSSALNPAIRIGAQLRELLDLHEMGTATERDERVRQILPEVGLPNDDAFLRRYPHQLSGGQVQRVALAMTFLPRPKVLVLDEPTTGLDVTTQAMVLQLLQELCQRFSVAALYVTHDLAVVASIADRVLVMYGGQGIEDGPAHAVFAEPAHPYTRALLEAIPHVHEAYALAGIPGEAPAPGYRPAGCRFHPRCRFASDTCGSTKVRLEPVGRPEGQHRARCLRVGELPRWDPRDRVVADTPPGKHGETLLAVEQLQIYYGAAHVVHDVSCHVGSGEVVALVGESGSGKTTIAQCIGGLHDQWEGTLTLRGEQLARAARQRTSRARRQVQYIFQNPYQSLNPRRTVEQIMVRPLELFGLASGAAARTRAAELLESVQLGAGVLHLRTNRLSGGERQRVAIARALAAEPDILICDEITSALDVSIQGSITELLSRVRAERGISMLFITHDLALVRSIADRVLVLRDGHLVESGSVVDVLDHPQAQYTKDLLANTPSLAAHLP
ncbi:MAG: peptide ABC transporter ATP-binding protein [Micrococcales bacterium]|nr:MAG: peptide ABC transporter ATP-binding protein [Micrococcales bacterium]